MLQWAILLLDAVHDDLQDMLNIYTSTSSFNVHEFKASSIVLSALDTEPTLTLVGMEDIGVVLIAAVLLYYYMGPIRLRWATELRRISIEVIFLGKDYTTE